VISNGMNPRYGDYDPYWMACSAIDEALRNCVATGADPKRTAILDNFCWGNTEKPETLGSLVRAAIGCHDAALAFETPFVSGKDSLNNEFTYVTPEGSQTIAIPSSLLISAMGQIEDVSHAVTMDLKTGGNELYLIGSTAAELGGSHLALVLEQAGAKRPDDIPDDAWNGVPRVDLKTAPKVLSALHSAMKGSLVRACHDLSEGGLAVAVAEMAFAGGLGVEVDVAAVGRDAGLSALAVLYSESNTRFVAEVRPADRDAFLSAFGAAGLAAPVRIGAVSGTGRVVIKSADEKLIDAGIDELRAAWKKPLAWE
jgi:phosphoribosylformylglycinamidine synthase